jgi:hypothetical protein
MGLSPQDVEEMMEAEGDDQEDEDADFSKEPRLFVDGPVDLPERLQYPEGDTGESLVQSRTDRQEGGMDFPFTLLDPRGPDPVVILTERGMTRFAADESHHGHGIHPLEIAELMTRKYGKSWTSWGTDTMRQTLQHDLGHDPDIAILNVIHALQVLAENPRGFWGDHDIFENVILGLNGMQAHTGVDDYVSPGQMAFGVTIAKDLIGGQPEDSVKAYTAVRLFGNPNDPHDSGPGILFAMEPLQYAQGYLDLLNQRHGGAQIDKAAIRSRLRELHDTPLEEAGLSSADPVDNQVALLLGVRDYVLEQEAGV